MSLGTAFIVPGFYSSVWMIVLLVQSDQVLAGLTCFQCSAVSNLTTCTSTVRCLDNEKCYAERDSSGENDVYNLGCEDRTACHVWESSWTDSLVGRRRGANVGDGADDTEGEQPWCNKCCDSDSCNQFLCSMGSNWLNKTCTSNADCPARNSECFAHVCLCTPGYYYSHSQDSCVASCSDNDLGEDFLTYPLIAVNSLTYQPFWGVSVEQCKEHCRVIRSCRTMCYSSDNFYCYILGFTALHTAGWLEQRSDFDAYQRTCA